MTDREIMCFPIVSWVLFLRRHFLRPWPASGLPWLALAGRGRPLVGQVGQHAAMTGYGYISVAIAIARVASC